MMRLRTRGNTYLRPYRHLFSKPFADQSIHPSSTQSCTGCRSFAVIKELDVLDRHVWFTNTAPWNTSPIGGEGQDHRPPNERTLQLGKTVRELHERLPTLLQTPLPSDILSPQITLHLFPSTHPHLPTVSGRIAYAAALWTAPVAWGCIPLIGNVKLSILSERMVRSGAYGEEKLIVKWQTRGKGAHRDTSGGIYRDKMISARDPEDKIRNFLKAPAAQQATPTDEHFCGLFIFEFDDTGRIHKHTIEHTEQGGYEDKTTKFVNVTDWLLGRLNGSGNRGPLPALAFHAQEPSNHPKRFPWALTGTRHTGGRT